MVHPPNCPIQLRYLWQRRLQVLPRKWMPSARTIPLCKASAKSDKGTPAATQVDTVTGQAFISLAQSVVTVTNLRNKNLPKTKIIQVNNQ
jgi:hypothetical protein